ncbi:RES domain protein [Gloeothece citriformis PCC 7424]|uniref:RES domain protein n=1 Tax=Gloeothece citriformis (strain PCC 7424) TaxID=65393 RepID=B7KA70_GLOC7|nr:RES family NAD+ phosphorylase [Gloeothece citriformis]ACK72844.1 RES domain protein [Gloeothece citriformis PCC 7424]
MGNLLQPNDLPEHPSPPADFFSRTLPVIQTSGPWFRLNPVQYSSAIYFDRSGKGRFDGENQGYGIFYGGEDENAVFIECYGRVHGAVGVAEKDLKQRNLFSITADRELTIVDLSSNNLVKIGADARLCSGAYVIARQWAKAIWEHPLKVDGLRYRSRHDDACFCYGLFDRVKDNLQEENLGNLIDHHPLLLSKILDRYDYALF